MKYEKKTMKHGKYNNFNNIPIAKTRVENEKKIKVKSKKYNNTTKKF